MSLSKEAKELLAKNPELIREIAIEYFVNNLDITFTDFVQKHTEPKRDWEIVEVYTEFHKCSIENGRINSGYGGGLYTTVENAIKELGYKIHSVRRLSDNEVFSVGDDTIFGKIKSFVISDWEFLSKINRNNEKLENANKMYVEFNQISPTKQWSAQHLCNIKKSKPSADLKVSSDIIIPIMLSDSMKELVKKYVEELLKQKSSLR